MRCKSIESSFTSTTGTRTYPLISYASLRPFIRTGDVILWKGRGIISWLIRRWSRFSHASLVVRLEKYKHFEDRVFLVEALETGLALRFLSHRLALYDGRAYLFQPCGMSDEHRSCIQEQAVTHLAHGIRYDYMSLFRNMLGRVSVNARRYFCSEFVWDQWCRCEYIADQEPDDVWYDNNRAPRPGDIPDWVDGALSEIVF